MPPADDAGRPTPKMVRLYHALSDRLGGEPADLWTYEAGAATPANPGHTPTLKHVMVWPADDELDITTFNTLGMSEQPIPEADYSAELHRSEERRVGKECRSRWSRNH